MENNQTCNKEKRLLQYLKQNRQGIIAECKGYN